eukprot:5958339-Amphidinium_carterae.1
MHVLNVCTILHRIAKNLARKPQQLSQRAHDLQQRPEFRQLLALVCSIVDAKTGGQHLSGTEGAHWDCESLLWQLGVLHRMKKDQPRAVSMGNCQGRRCPILEAPRSRFHKFHSSAAIIQLVEHFCSCCRYRCLGHAVASNLHIEYDILITHWTA